jgi:hypothetical protein
MMIVSLPAQRAFLVHSLRLQFLVRAARQGRLLRFCVAEQVGPGGCRRRWQEPFGSLPDKFKYRFPLRLLGVSKEEVDPALPPW